MGGDCNDAVAEIIQVQSFSPSSVRKIWMMMVCRTARAEQETITADSRFTDDLGLDLVQI